MASLEEEEEEEEEGRWVQYDTYLYGDAVCTAAAASLTGWTGGA